MKTALTLFCLLFVARLVPAVDTPVSITLERTVCHGTCPSYVVTILADGSVTFEGRKFVKVTGVSEKKIEPAKLDRIYKKIEEIHFWELHPKYRIQANHDGSFTVATDAPTKIVTVKTATKTRKVVDYYGAPEGLKDLENLIDEVAGVSEWVGTPEERKP